MKPHKLTEKDIEKLPKNKQIMLAVFAAELVLDKVEPQHLVAATKAISSAKLYLEGKATQEDCRMAADAVYADAGYASYAAAAYAAYAAYAADAADATGYAAADAYGAYAGYWAYHTIKRASEANKEVIEPIYNYYDALLNLDKYVEEGLLK